MKQIITIITVCLLAGSALANDIDWQKNYDSALEQAKKEKKLVMVDIYTDWCGWCKKLDRDTYSDKDVQAKLAKNFIAVKINPEKSQKNAQLAEQFGKAGYPHIVFLDSNGKKFSEIIGYKPAADFLQKLEQVSTKPNTK